METKIYVYFILCLLYATNAQDIEPPDLSEFPRPTTKITLMTTEGPNGPKFDKILNMVSESSTTELAETTMGETETTTATPVIITTTTMPETTTTSTSTTTPTTSTTEPPISTTTMPETTTKTQTTFTTTITSTTEPPISTTTTKTSTPETPISTTTTTTPEPPINTQSTSTTTTPSPWLPITTKKIKLPPCWNCYYKEMLGYPHLEFTSTGLKYVHSLNCYRCCYYIGSEFAGCTQISHLICEDYYARAKKLND